MFHLSRKKILKEDYLEIKREIMENNKRLLHLEGLGKMSWGLVLNRLGFFFIDEKDAEDGDYFDSEWFSVYNNLTFFLTKVQRIKELQLIDSFKGERHYLNMPVRGQRTRTNARTRRKRKVI